MKSGLIVMNETIQIRSLNQFSVDSKWVHMEINDCLFIALGFAVVGLIASFALPISEENWWAKCLFNSVQVILGNH